MFDLSSSLVSNRIEILLVFQNIWTGLHNLQLVIASDSKYPPKDNDKYNKPSCEFKRHVVSLTSRMILHYLACEQFYLYS